MKEKIRAVDCKYYFRNRQNLFSFVFHIQNPYNSDRLKKNVFYLLNDIFQYEILTYKFNKKNLLFI